MYYGHNCVNLTMNLNYEVVVPQLENLPINPALCMILFHACYVQNYAGIIGTNLNTKYFNSIPHSGKGVWRGEVRRIVSDSFAKLKPSKLVVNNLLTDLLIRQTFFAKCLKRVNSPNLSPAKLSHYMVL